ncbi:hypothetical protein ANMWB30_23080 [Arthrobacter sp. MWB30]|nr:hypothetical protein ANMWB30_23080 [Arthrobacter sp. MWB30]
MTENEQPGEGEQRRVNKREFLADVSARTHVPLQTVTRVYGAILDELLDVMRRGDPVILTGFGKFYRQEHKGHKARFATDATPIEDYFVLKFSATRAVNKSLAPGGTLDEDDQEDAVEPVKKPAGKKNPLIAREASPVAGNRSTQRANRLLLKSLAEDSPI